VQALVVQLALEMQRVQLLRILELQQVQLLQNQVLKDEGLAKLWTYPAEIVAASDQCHTQEAR